MDLAQHLRVIWRRKWLVLALAAAVGGLIYAYSRTLDRQYAADTLLSVTSGRSAGGQTGAQEDNVFLAATYARLAETRPIAVDAARRAGISIPPAEAERRLSSRASSDLGFLSVRASGPTPAGTMLLANGAADALVDAVARQQEQLLERDLDRLRPQLAAIQRQLARLKPGDPRRVSLEAQYAALIQERTRRQLQPANRVEVVQAAITPTKPESPRPIRNAVLAFLIALVVGAELLVLVELLSDRFRPETVNEESRSATGLPILAEIPRGGDDEAIEAFRILRTHLTFLKSNSQIRTLAIVGDELGSGKSFAAVGLARAFSALDAPVVLVDGDLRRPVIHERLGISSLPGLGDLANRSDVESVLHAVPGDPYLKVITAGTPVPDPAGLLGGELRRILDRIKAVELVIVDTPAAGYFADATAIAAQCDATILIIGARTTKRRALKKLVDTLHRVEANPIGIVVNRVEPMAGRAYYDRREARVRSIR